MTQKLLSCLFFAIICLPALGQVSQIGHDLTIFSGNGLKFSLTINGAKINEEPAANVVASNLNTDWVQAIITFEDTNIPPIKKNILQLKSANNHDNHPEAVVYEIKAKKDEYALKWSSSSAKKIQQTNTVIIQQQPAPAQPSGIQITVPGVKVNVDVPK